MGMGCVLIRDNDTGAAKFWTLSIEGGDAVGKWSEIQFIPPKDTVNEILGATEPFYMGYHNGPSNPIVYVYERDDDDGLPSIQYANLHDFKLTRFANDVDLEACTRFVAQNDKIALCDADYRYFIGEGQELLVECPNPNEKMDRIVQDLAITGGRHAVPVALLHPLPGRETKDPVRIRWWNQGAPMCFENDKTYPEGIVCFDDAIVWHGRNLIGYVDVSSAARSSPVTSSFTSIPAAGRTVALAKSGTTLRLGNLWYATVDGGIYHVDVNAGTSLKVLDAGSDVGHGTGRGSAVVSQMWADDFFLYVLTDNGRGAAWRISDVVEDKPSPLLRTS